MAKRSDNYGGVGHNLPPELRAAWKAADKLEAVAERTIADAQAEHDRPRLMNTARRARMGSGVMEEQQRRIANAKTAKQIAEALRDGRAGPLAKISSLADVERLHSAYRSAMYANDQKRKANPGSMIGVEPDKGDIKFAKPSAFVSAHMFESDIETLRQRLKGKDVQQALNRMEAKIARDRDNRWIHRDPKDIAAVETIAKAIKKQLAVPAKESWRQENRGLKHMAWNANKWLASIREYEAQRRLGLADVDGLRTMLDAYADVRVNRPGADPVKAAERALIGVKMPGYFPTPESLAKRMADLADIREGQTVLEPSAGSGRLADVAKARGANVETVEMQSRLRDLLKKKGHKLVGSDFTDMKPEAKYDRILMNPPFEKRADADHVRRAYEHLKPGGKMVAIMGEGTFFGSDKKAIEFREWLQAAGGTSEKLPEGTFKESNTGVNTRLVVIEKPPAAPSAATVHAAMQTAPSNAKPVGTGLDGAYERNGVTYGKVLGIPAEVRPGSDGDPFKYKTSYHESGPLDSKGYPTGQKIIHAATLEDFERQIREHKGQNPNWIDPKGVGGNKPMTLRYQIQGWLNNNSVARGSVKTQLEGALRSFDAGDIDGAVLLAKKAAKNSGISDIQDWGKGLSGWSDEARAASAEARAAKAEIGHNQPKGVVQDVSPSTVTKGVNNISLKIGDQQWSTVFHDEHPETFLKHNIHNLRETYRQELAKRFNEAVARGDTLNLKGVTLKHFGDNGQALDQVKLKPEYANALDGKRETTKGSGKRAWTAKAYSPDKLSFFGQQMPLTSKEAGVIAKALGMPSFKEVVSEIDSAVKTNVKPVAAAAPKPKDPGIMSAVERAIARSSEMAAKAKPQLLPAPPAAVEASKPRHDLRMVGIPADGSKPFTMAILDGFEGDKSAPKIWDDTKGHYTQKLAGYELQDKDGRVVGGSAPPNPALEVRRSGKRFEVLDNGKPILDSKGNPKWFGSKEKADAFLAKRGFANESTLNAALKAQGKAEKGKAKPPKLGKDSGLRFVGTDRTLERGPVNVYMSRSGTALVGDVNAPLDTDGRPLGLRQAPSGIEMAAAKNNKDHRFHETAKRANPDSVSPNFKPAKPSVADLRAEAKAAGIKGAAKMTKSALMNALNKVGAVALVAAPVTAAVLAYDAKKSEAQAAGATSSSATGSAVASGAIAGGTVAAVGYGVAKGITWGVRGAAAAGAAIGAPVLGPVAAGVATAAGVALMARGAYQGWQKHGAKGAAFGLVGADGLLDRKTTPSSGPVNGRLNASQATEFAAANATFQAMKAAPSNVIGTSDTGRGFANVKVQQAAQQARGRVYDPSRKVQANG